MRFNITSNLNNNPSSLSSSQSSTFLLPTSHQHLISPSNLNLYVENDHNSRDNNNDKQAHHFYHPHYIQQYFKLKNTDNNSKNDEMWKQIEFTIQDNLLQFENARKFCAYCGCKENENDCRSSSSSNIILGRCYGCQMVYYCKQEHQYLDWLENHMPKCAELEWVALGELIQSMPVDLPLPEMNMFWPFIYNKSNEFKNNQLMVNTWTDWFDIRHDLVTMCHQIAKTFEKNLKFNCSNSNNSGLNRFNRREPPFNDLVDGLLASITDSMTYALTIGDALINLNINVSLKPICIHILNPSSDLFDDLNVYMSSATASKHLNHTEIEISLKRKFYELCNMFPYNKGFELVFISNQTSIKLTESQSYDWSQILPSPFFKNSDIMKNTNKSNILHISSYSGTYANFIKYVSQIEDYVRPDIIISFNSNYMNFTCLNQHEDLNMILTLDIPSLFTFRDKCEKETAFQLFSGKYQANFITNKANQFSSLLLKQIPAKPNHIYATNSFCMIIKGYELMMAPICNNKLDDSIYLLKLNMTDTISNNIVKNSNLTLSETVAVKRSKSIHDLMSNSSSYLSIKNNDMVNKNFINNESSKFNTIHHDVCIQTLGLEEPENLSLRHINGKLKITKSIVNNYQINQSNSKNDYNTFQYRENQHHHQNNLNNFCKSNEHLNRLVVKNGLNNMTEFYLNNNNNNSQTTLQSTLNEQKNNIYNDYLTQQKHNQAKTIPLLDFSFQKVHRDINYKADTKNKSDITIGYRPRNFFFNRIYDPNQFYQPKVLVIPKNTLLNDHEIKNPHQELQNCNDEINIINMSNNNLKHSPSISTSTSASTSSFEQQNKDFMQPKSETKLFQDNIIKHTNQKSNELQTMTIHTSLIQPPALQSVESLSFDKYQQQKQIPIRPRKLSISSSTILPKNSFSIAISDDSNTNLTPASDSSSGFALNSNYNSTKFENCEFEDLRNDQQRQIEQFIPYTKPRISNITDFHANEISNCTETNTYDKLDKYKTTKTGKDFANIEEIKMPNIKPRVNKNEDEEHSVNNKVEESISSCSSFSFTDHIGFNNNPNANKFSKSEFILLEEKSESKYLNEKKPVKQPRRKKQPAKLRNPRSMRPAFGNPLPKPRNPRSMTTTTDSNMSDDENDDFEYEESQSYINVKNKSCKHIIDENLCEEQEEQIIENQRHAENLQNIDTDDKKFDSSVTSSRSSSGIMISSSNSSTKSFSNNLDYKQKIKNITNSSLKKHETQSTNRQSKQLLELQSKHDSNNNFVNQMKNIFELSLNSISDSTSVSSKNIQNLSVSLVNNKNDSNASTCEYQQNKRIVYKNTPDDQEAEYSNLKTEKYLDYFLKQPKMEVNEVLPPPPLPPLPPPSLAPLSPKNTFELAQLESSPFKHHPKHLTNDKLVSQIICSSPTKNVTVKNKNCNSEELKSDFKPNKQVQRLMSNTSSTTNYTFQSVKLTPTSNLSTNNSSTNNNHIPNEFRILNQNSFIPNSSDRSTTPSSKSLSSLTAQQQNSVGQIHQQQKIMIKHIPDAVDVVKLDFEGQRRVIVPGYMTSADILRNMILNSNGNNQKEIANTNSDLKASAPLIIQRQTNNMSLKERLILQQKLQKQSELQQHSRMNILNRNQTDENKLTEKIESVSNKQFDDDEFLSRKFDRTRNRTRSMSGIIRLDLVQGSQIIDIDLDYETDNQNSKQHEVETLKSQTNDQTQHQFYNQLPIIQPKQTKDITESITKSNNKISLNNKITIQYQSSSYAPVPPPPPPPPLPAPETQNFVCNMQPDTIFYTVPSENQLNQVQFRATSTPTNTKKQLFSLPENIEKNKIYKTESKMSLNQNAHYAVSQIFPDNCNEQNHFFSETNQQQKFRNNNSRRIISPASTNLKQSVTGSFDPNDFDSFDEGDDDNGNFVENMHQKKEKNIVYSETIECIKDLTTQNNFNKKVQLESIEKIRESASIQQKFIEPDILINNLVQFDPEDFDSFDESDLEDKNKKQEKQQLSKESNPIIQLPLIEFKMDQEKKNYEYHVDSNMDLQPIIENEKNKEFCSNISKTKRQSEEFLANKKKLEALFNKRHSNNDVSITTKSKEIISIKKEDISLPVIIIENGMPPPPPPPLPPSLTTIKSSDIETNLAINNNTKQSSNFFRSALNRISNRSSTKSINKKNRSSSVPLRTLINSELKSNPIQEIANNQENELELKEPFNLQEFKHQSKNSKNNNNSNAGIITNMKTLQIMNKMQIEFEEKQKKRKIKRQIEQEKANQSTSSLKSPNNERKFLSSIINTLFSSTSINEQSCQETGTDSNLSKNDSKRTSLKKIKAKDKAKKNTIKSTNKGDNDCQSDGEMAIISSTSQHQDSCFKKSNQSLNVNLINSFSFYDDHDATFESRFGTIKNEILEKQETSNDKENIIKRLKAELDEEIKDRKLIEMKQTILNSSNIDNFDTSPTHSSSILPTEIESQKINENNILRRSNAKKSKHILTLEELNERKSRSKSVTFLDEMLSEEEHDQIKRNQQEMDFKSLDNKQKQSKIQKEKDSYYLDNETDENLDKNQRAILNGTGQIKSIMKKSATDLSIIMQQNLQSNLNSNFQLNTENIDFYLNCDSNIDCNNSKIMKNISKIQIEKQTPINYDLCNEDFKMLESQPKPQQRNKSKIPSINNSNLQANKQINEKAINKNQLMQSDL